MCFYTFPFYWIRNIYGCKKAIKYFNFHASSPAPFSVSCDQRSGHNCRHLEISVVSLFGIFNTNCSIQNIQFTANCSRSYRKIQSLLLVTGGSKYVIPIIQLTILSLKSFDSYHQIIQQRYDLYFKLKMLLSYLENVFLIHLLFLCFFFYSILFCSVLY